MKTYKSVMDIMDDKDLTDAEGAAAIDAFNAARGRIGCWSGHDGLTAPAKRHPDTDKIPSDMVSEPNKGVCPHCHTYCDGDCRA